MSQEPAMPSPHDEDSTLAPEPAPTEHRPIPALVPARMINEVLYCERLCYLEWAQGEFDDNAFTVEGRVVHRRADQPGGDLPPAPAGEREAKPERPAASQDDDDEPAPEPRPYQARSVWLSSERLGITAKIDVVDGEEGGRVIPIEYNRGAAPDLPEGAYLPERAQIAAQALLLRDEGYACDDGAIYFAASRRRVPVVIDDALLQKTLAAAARAREIAARGQIPPPLVDSPKCHGCSLVGICLPDETNLLRRLDGLPADEPEPDSPREELDALLGPDEPDPAGLYGTIDPRAELRRLHPARDDALPVYVQDQGARVSLEGDRLIIAGRKQGRTEAKLPSTSQVSLLGNVQITTQALRALLTRGIPLSFFTTGGGGAGVAARRRGERGAGVLRGVLQDAEGR